MVKIYKSNVITILCILIASVIGYMIFIRRSVVNKEGMSSWSHFYTPHKAPGYKAITVNGEKHDFPGNDINDGYYENISLTHCKEKCEKKSDCVGLVTNFANRKGPGKCWLKSSIDFANPIPKNNRYTRWLTRS
jgi:hypothetical protein